MSYYHVQDFPSHPNSMGHFVLGRGETLEARRLHEEALTLFRSSGELEGTSDSLRGLGQVAYALGEYDEGRRLLEKSLAIQHVVGSKITIADFLELLGEIATAQGEFAEAETHFRQRLTILRDLGHREHLSWTLAQLGAAVLAQGRQSDAAMLLAEALAIAEDCGDPRGIALAHKELGYLALKQGAPDRARRHWRMAIRATWGAQDRADLLVTLDALIGLATLVANENDMERAVEVLTLVRGAANIDRRTETKAEQLLAKLESRFSPAHFAAAQVRGRALELGATVTVMLAQGLVSHAP